MDSARRVMLAITSDPCQSAGAGRPTAGRPLAVLARSTSSGATSDPAGGGLPMEDATRNIPSRPNVADVCLKQEDENSPNTKYRSRSALLQERASKLVSGSGELTTRVEPAAIGREA